MYRSDIKTPQCNLLGSLGLCAFVQTLCPIQLWGEHPSRIRHFCCGALIRLCSRNRSSANRDLKPLKPGMEIDLSSVKLIFLRLISQQQKVCWTHSREKRMLNIFKILWHKMFLCIDLNRKKNPKTSLDTYFWDDFFKYCCNNWFLLGLNCLFLQLIGILTTRGWWRV